MKTYNPNAECPYCKSINNYCKPKDDPLGKRIIMVRKCRICGYAWYEEPLDAEKVIEIQPYQ